MQSLSWEVPWLTYSQSQSVAAVEFISQCFDHSARVLDQEATEPLFFSIIPATSVRCGLFSEAPSTQSCKYWVGKKVNLCFSVMAYGKPWMNFLATPFFLSASKNSRGKFSLYLWLSVTMLQQSPPKRLSSQFTVSLYRLSLALNWTTLCSKQTACLKSPVQSILVQWHN